SLEPGQGLGIDAHQGLEGHELAALPIERLEHLAHPTGAQAPAKLEAGGQGLPRNQHGSILPWGAIQRGSMISFAGVNKQYGGEILLVDASFQINPGERIGLVGPNGAGKSTVFRMLVGDEEADDGVIERPRKLTVGFFRQDTGDLAGRSILAET